MTKEEKEAAEAAAAKAAADQKAADAALRAELDTLKKENEAFKLAAERKAQEARPNSDEPTDAQWKVLEDRLGKDRDQIRKDWDMVQMAMAPVVAQNRELLAERAIEKNVKSAMEKAAASDPQFSKYAVYVNEYLEDVPADAKADPAKLAKAMEKAIRFARGSVKPGAESRREVPNLNKEKGEEDPNNEPDSETAYFGVNNGDKTMKGVSISISKLVPDDYRAKNAHPSFDGGVMIDEKAEWAAETARR